MPRGIEAARQRDSREAIMQNFKHSKTSFEKNFFCVGEYAEYGFDQQG